MENRVIKFRVWHEGYREFKYWGFIDGMFIGPPTGSNISIQDCKRLSQQFCGLLDKNGKEIYEGDIISWDYEYDSDYDGDMPIVKRSTGRAAIKDIFDRHQIFTARSEGKGCEVIGNIWETPELLKPQPVQK